MSPTRQVARRFLAWLLANIAFVAATLLFMKPRGIPADPALLTTVLQALGVAAIFTLGVLTLSSKVNDEAFSRRMMASVFGALLIILKFDRFDLGRLLSISNPALSAMFTFWAILIVVNVALRSLHTLTPSRFR